MTRKHFQILAMILRLFGNITEEQKETINAILKAQNQNFNPVIFWERARP